MGSVNTMAGSVGEALASPDWSWPERSFRSDDRPEFDSGIYTSALGTGWPRISVIVPTLNEARNLPHVFAELPRGLHEVIVVDGFSTDGTPEVARSLRPDVKIVKQTQARQGRRPPLRLRGRNGRHPRDAGRRRFGRPGRDPRLRRSADAGRRLRQGHSLPCRTAAAPTSRRLRSAGNRVLSGTVNLLFGTSYSDLCYGYNAFWRHCLPAMHVDCTGFEVETLINIRIARAGLKVREVPSFERERIHGESHLNTFRDGGRVLRIILRERFRRMPRLGDGELASRKSLSAEAA